MVNNMYYINTFFIFSIFGFIFETFINMCLKQKLNSGFLYGPYTPIYGIGVIIIILINKWLDKKDITKSKKIIITFLINSIILTISELIGGYLIKWIFHQNLWDYSGLPLHIGKYISIEISIIWGILSLIYIYCIKKITDVFIKKIPKYISYEFIIIFIIDLIITLITKTKILF